MGGGVVFMLYLSLYHTFWGALFFEHNTVIIDPPATAPLVTGWYSSTVYGDVRRMGHFDVCGSEVLTH